MGTAYSFVLRVAIFVRVSIEFGRHAVAILRDMAAVALVFVLAWALVEIFPRGWELFEAWLPQPAHAVQDLVRPFWTLLAWQTLTAFTVAAIGAGVWGTFLREPIAKWSCRLLWFIGFVLVVRFLHFIAQEDGEAIASVVTGVAWIKAFFAVAYGQIEYLITSWISSGWQGVVRTALRFLYELALLLLYALRGTRNAIQDVRYGIYEALAGDVDRLFPRQSNAVAERAARDRRKKIFEFVGEGKLPRRYTERRFSERYVREYVEKREEVTEVTPLRVPEFIELPDGSPIIVKRACLEGYEEIAGQYSRLTFEARLPVANSSENHHGVSDETLVLLLARVVDAAILADRDFDALREESAGWNAMPSFDRIYVEQVKLPKPLECLLGPIFGDGVPARVVIETHYGDVFRNGLFGPGRQKPNAFGKWFGIGIKIENPNQAQGFLTRIWRGLGFKMDTLKIEHEPWRPAASLCRRLKSRVPGVLSGVVRATLKRPKEDSEQENYPADEHDSFNLMPYGSLADGCPSTAVPLPDENWSIGAAPPVVPLLRGGVSNAPPVWIVKPQRLRPPECSSICLKNPRSEKNIPVEQADLTVDYRPEGAMQESAGQLRARFLVPGARNLLVRRKAWVGAFFDYDMRLGNRFPLLACAPLIQSSRPLDLRGAFARRDKKYLPRSKARRDRYKDHDLEGVFVSVAGPAYATNLLLPGALFADFLGNILYTSAIARPCEGKEWVPSPEQQFAR